MFFASHAPVRPSLHTVTICVTHQGPFTHVHTTKFLTLQIHTILVVALIIFKKKTSHFPQIYPCIRRASDVLPFVGMVHESVLIGMHADDNSRDMHLRDLLGNVYSSASDRMMNELSFHTAVLQLEYISALIEL